MYLTVYSCYAFLFFYRVSDTLLYKELTNCTSYSSCTFPIQTMQRLNTQSRHNATLSYNTKGILHAPVTLQSVVLAFSMLVTLSNVGITHRPFVIQYASKARIQQLLPTQHGKGAKSSFCLICGCSQCKQDRMIRLK